MTLLATFSQKVGSERKNLPRQNEKALRHENAAAAGMAAAALVVRGYTICEEQQTPDWSSDGFQLLRVCINIISK